MSRLLVLVDECCVLGSSDVSSGRHSKKPGAEAGLFSNALQILITMDLNQKGATGHTIVAG
jgi:hypothetical protein